MSANIEATPAKDSLTLFFRPLLMVIMASAALALYAFVFTG